MYSSMSKIDSRASGPTSESATLGIFTQAIARVEETLQMETAIVSEYRNDELPMLNERKTRALFDLDRAIKGLHPEDVTEDAWRRVSGLRDQLEESRRLLLIHLNAAREISALIEKVMAESDSDGTYNFASFKRP
jgi:hypothetical protein